MVRLLPVLVGLILTTTSVSGGRSKTKKIQENPNLPSLNLHCLESEAISFLGGSDFDDSYCGDTIRQVMERGWWDVTAKLVKECRARDFKVASPVYKAKSNLNKQLNIITNLLSGPSAVISPAFQWSQSKDYILIEVKFAHKLDTPATLGVKSNGADLKGTSLTFDAASKSKNKRFKLNLKLAREIIPEESEWSMAAVGRATFSLKKKHPETAWTKLMHPSQAVPQNMHTWWAMKEQHENEVKVLDTSLTDTSAIKKAEEKRKENANSSETGSEIDEEAAASKDVGVDEDVDAGSSSTGETASTESAAPSSKNLALQKLRNELEKEKLIARKNILLKTDKSSKEIEENFLSAKRKIDTFADAKMKTLEQDAELQRTDIQRSKAEALQNLEQDYSAKLQALESSEL